MIEGQLYYIIKKLNQNNQEGVYDDVENALIAIMGFIDGGCDDANEMGTIKRNNMLNKMDIAEKNNALPKTTMQAPSLRLDANS
jgi:hypothetical protein